MGYSMRDFRIRIPEELIAQYPAVQRQKSRLLVYDITNDRTHDDLFQNIGRYIMPDDCVVYNDTRVIHARMFGEKEDTGARIEILLTKKIEPGAAQEWIAILRPAKRVKVGSRITFPLRIDMTITEALGEGLFRVHFSKKLGYDDLRKIGEIPLPKYIKRKPEFPLDDIRYQTVFSRKYGAVASPTAGLHFTEEIIDSLKKQGVVFVPITLNVAWGTFRPVREDDYRRYRMHSEEYEITGESAHSINRCIAEKRRIVCVGTTSVRTIESAAGEDGFVSAGSGETSLFIYPGYRFRVTDAMITNFHMADSTLILLVAAFAGKQQIEKIYNHAVSEKYRFFSYGDAMFLHR